MKKRKQGKTILKSIMQIILLGLIGSVFSVIPDTVAQSILILIIVWSLSIITYTGITINLVSPNVIFEYIGNVSLSLIWLIIAIHRFLFYQSLWMWIIIFGFLFCIVWLLPIISSKIASFIHTEVCKPQTWFGKYILRGILLIIGVGGLGGALLGRGITRLFDIRLSMTIFAFILAIFSLFLSILNSYPLWKKIVSKKTV